MEPQVVPSENKNPKRSHTVSLILKQLQEYFKLFSSQKWTRRFISFVWIIVIGLVCFGLWKYRNDILPYLFHANYFYLITASFFFLLAIASASTGWAVIMKSFAPDLTPWKHIYIYCVTLAARRAPGTIWYIGGRLGLYQRFGISKISVSLASMVEIMVSIISASILSLVLLPFGIKIQTPLIILLFAGVIIGLLIIHPRILSSILIKLKRPVDRSFEIKNSVTWLLINFLTWIAGGFMFYFMVKTFTIINFGNLILIMDMWAIAGVAGMLTTFLPSSFGVTDITLAAFLTTLVPLPIAVVISLINRFLTTILEVAISSFFYYFTKLE